MNGHERVARFLEADLIRRLAGKIVVARLQEEQETETAERQEVHPLRSAYLGLYVAVIGAALTYVDATGSVERERVRGALGTLLLDLGDEAGTEALGSLWTDRVYRTACEHQQDDLEVAQELLVLLSGLFSSLSGHRSQLLPSADQQHRVVALYTAITRLNRGVGRKQP